MRIKITSDSTCDLSSELIQQNDIGIMPLTVIKNGVEFRDGINISPEDIFSHVDAGGDLCSTAAVNIDEYSEFFKTYAQSYDAVIHINIGSGFSSCHQNARIASQDYDNVRVIDSQNLSTGQGLVVLKACALASNCDNLDNIVTLLNEFTTKVEASFLLDQLKYMVKGGRCSTVKALGANLLGLKPCIEVKEGKMTMVKKYRGNYAKCLTSYIKERLCDRDDLDKETLFVTYTPVTEDCLNAVQQTIAQVPQFDNTYWTNAGCTVSCHCGPGTLGVLFVRK